MKHNLRIGFALAMAGLLSACAQTPATKQMYQPSVLTGSVAADRTIVLGPDTDSVAVTYGQTVRFVTPSGQSFVVKFDGTRATADLTPLAPAGALNRPVMAYISITDSVPGQ